MRATHTIPIVFTWVSDSVGSGYVANLAHPGGNITGFHNYEPELGGKWLGLLKEVAPAVKRVAVLHVPEIAANVAFIRTAEAASSPLGIPLRAPVYGMLRMWSVFSATSRMKQTAALS